MPDAEKNEFYTLKGYRMRSGRAITETMEDYLEMICRCAGKEGHVRIHLLAEKLNVRPSSASKMVGNLKALGLVEYEPYGLIRPSARGLEIGHYLLHRHQVLNAFFCLVNHSEAELEQVEQIEHFISRETVYNLEKLMEWIKAVGAPAKGPSAPDGKDPREPSPGDGAAHPMEDATWELTEAREDAPVDFAVGAPAEDLPKAVQKIQEKIPAGDGAAHPMEDAAWELMEDRTDDAILLAGDPGKAPDAAAPSFAEAWAEPSSEVEDAIPAAYSDECQEGKFDEP